MLKFVLFYARKAACVYFLTRTGATRIIMIAVNAHVVSLEHTQAFEIEFVLAGDICGYVMNEALLVAAVGHLQAAINFDFLFC
jgi:hypothetical protein